MKENQNPKAIYLKDYQKPDYLITSTHLEFYIDEDKTLVKSKLDIYRNPELALNNLSLPPLFLNGVDLALNSLRCDGRELGQSEYQLSEEGLNITVSKSEFTLEIETLIKPRLNTALEGLYVSKGMYCTQCEAHGFRRITYYLDRPDVMSSFEVYIEADKNQYPVLLSNGNPLAKGDLKNGRHWARWQDPFKKPCYLFALVAGNLQCVEDTFIRRSGKPVALRLFVEQQDMDKCAYALESLKHAMAWDEKVFGREYDLDIYMIVAVNHFNMGAMENKGLNIFNTSCVLANQKTTTDAGFERVEGVVAHEYFHNWSGNRVTCRDWFQLSLKEGFTVYRDEEFSSDMGSRTVKRIDDVNLLRSFQFKEDAGPMAHPVRPASYIEMNNFYTSTVYNKGAEVVRMLHTLLGAEKFREACDLYFEKFDGQAVTCDDFVACMETVSGKNLTQFKRWYSQAGTPVVEAQATYDSQSRNYLLTLKQSCPATPGQDSKESFVIPVNAALFSQAGEKLSFSINGEVKTKACLLLLDETEKTFVFTDVAEAPLPSLLRNFSAPIKLKFPYSAEELAILLSHDDDGFNAWDAGQQLSLNILKSLIKDVQEKRPLQVDNTLLAAFTKLLNKKNLDKALLARLLTLPNKSYLAEQFETIDVDAMITAHNFLEQALAKNLYELFLKCYQENISTENYKPNAQQSGQRSLKNVCLHYLLLSASEHALMLAETQFKEASNMTDQNTALRTVVHSAYVYGASKSYLSLRASLLNNFYQQWQKEALVIDQWFTVQAMAQSDDIVNIVEKLLSHEAFDFENPNRVRSLIAAFAQNTAGFHQRDGKGYQFFALQVQKLNKINPQIAARLVAALVHWRRYDSGRSVLMKAELEKLMAMPDLSKDVYEIVSRALN